MGRNLPSFSRFLARIAIVTLVVVIESPHVANVADGDQEVAEVLGQIEVRGQQPDLSDGRTTSYAAAASYLFSPVRPGGERVGFVDEDSVAERGAEALAAISYPWRDHLGGWTIEFG